MFYQTIVDRQTLSPHPPIKDATIHFSDKLSCYKLGIFSNFIYYWTNYLRVNKLAPITQIMFNEIEIKNPVIPHKTTVWGQVSNN